MKGLTFFQRLQIDTAVRKEWYGVFSAMTSERTRMPVSAALKEMATEFKQIGHPMAPLVALLIARMTMSGGKGDQLVSSRMGDALSGMVPDGEAILIKSGEMRGDVSRGLGQAAYLVGSIDGLLNSVRKAMGLSIIYVFVLLGMYAFFGLELLPQMEKTQPRQQWPLLSQRFGFVADHIVFIAVGVAVLGIGGWLLVKFLSRNWRGAGRLFADTYIWPFTTIRLMNSSSLLMGLSGFIKAGSPFDQAVGFMAETATAPYMRDKYARILHAVQSGEKDFNAVLASQLVPKERGWIIRLYGRTADFGSAIDEIAQDFVKYATARTERMALLLNLAGMVFTAANIGWMAAAVGGVVGSIK